MIIRRSSVHVIRASRIADWTHGNTEGGAAILPQIGSLVELKLQKFWRIIFDDCPVCFRDELKIAHHFIVKPVYF